MAKIRVYELAKELGVSTEVVLTRLNNMGEFGRSAASVVDAAVVRRLAESLESNPPARRRPGRPRPGHNPFSSYDGIALRRPAAAAPVPISQEERTRREAAEMFGVPPEDIKLARQAPPRRSGPRPSPRGRQPDSWARNLIDPESKKAWMDAGLGPDDGDRAQRCADAGLTPADLLLRVEGRRVGERIRGGGESIHWVAALVAEYKQRQADTG